MSQQICRKRSNAVSTTMRLLARPLALTASENFAAAGVEDLLVKGALFVVQFAEADLLDFFGQVAGHFALQAAQQKRAQAARETFLGCGFLSRTIGSS